jgi:hypothetical protein
LLPDNHQATAEPIKERNDNLSIASEITRINTNIAAAYSAASDKGAAMPQAQNSANLAATINSISGGSSTAAGKDINLYDYNLVVMPESSSQVNQYMLRYIYRFAQPSLHKMELVKALPSSISFDMDAYEQQYLDGVLETGRPRYTQAQKEEVKQSIRQMVDLIHKKDYFTIAKDVKKSRFRPYIMHFLKFASEDDKELCRQIRRQNVLIVDDVTTSGSTLNEILRTLRILNEDNDIRVFSLIGRKDLMADAL